jgi:glutamate/tyrosine decarboxylase-like PLP-dependent enzyme
MIGYPTDCGGLLVSGGNMGNFVGLLAARKAKATWDVSTAGLLTHLQKSGEAFLSSAVIGREIDAALRPAKH